jgi:NDP-sugar pyrophosphorylase family protein
MLLRRGEWTITCADAGEFRGTGARLRHAASFVPHWPVIVGGGNGLGDVDAADLVRFHRGHGRLATVVVAVPPPGPGRVELAGDHRVLGFGGRAEAGAGLVSTGVFVFEEAAVKKYIPLDGDVMLEAEPIRNMIADGELMAYRHHGHWEPPGTGEDVAPARPGVVRPAAGIADGAQPGPDGLSALTNRELQVATLIGNCLTNRAIARQLSVAEKTVEMHLSNIFGKLAVSSRTELAALMIRTQQA